MGEYQERILRTLRPTVYARLWRCRSALASARSQTASFPRKAGMNSCSKSVRALILNGPNRISSSDFSTERNSNTRASPESWESSSVVNRCRRTTFPF